MFYVEAANNDVCSTIADPDEVEKYNVLVAGNTHEQIYGNSREALESYKSYLLQLKNQRHFR